VQYLRIYAGPDGASHFATVAPELTPVEFVPGLPLVDLSSPTPATASAFARLPAGWYGDYHPTPRQQFVIAVSGTVDITTSDGETRRITPGTVIRLDDTTGSGHLTQVVGETPWCCLLLWLTA
jgi:hypothetical protein